MIALSVGLPLAQAQADNGAEEITWLASDDFTYGTYIIDRPGVYRLAEDISFNPNSPATLTEAVETGSIPAPLADALGLATPVDAYHAGAPLFTQFTAGPAPAFTPGGPLDARYDPAAYGVGFFAAISITSDDVVLDLNGYTLEQSEEHALLQRFFAVVELADQPFVPGQGPAAFGAGLDAARNVTITNGRIGRSSHHGIHGNANEDVTVTAVEFTGYEVAAIALNGVTGLAVSNVTATNRKDVPVLGTFSSARFIGSYVDHLVRSGSEVSIVVDGERLSPADIQHRLRAAINDTHHDLIVTRHLVDGRPQIDGDSHPVEYAVFNNPHGVVDGNSYSFLVNSLGVAVNGFPQVPDGITSLPSRDIVFADVAVREQRAFVNEVLAINAGGKAAIDPVGAVFQIWNLHPDTGRPITISDSDPSRARYVGNPVSNAQALVAKAAVNGDFRDSHLDISRLNIPAAVLDWVEGNAGAETLADIGVTYLCNGDSMFHVNKGAIGFKMDAAAGVRMQRTSVDGLINLGAPGSQMCGHYLNGFSHPLATLPGYGGAIVRGYSFAGSEDVMVMNGAARNLEAAYGSAVGFDVLTDSTDIRLVNAAVTGLEAGSVTAGSRGGPTATPLAIGFQLAADSAGVSIARGCGSNLWGAGGASLVADHTDTASVIEAAEGCVAVLTRNAPTKQDRPSGPGGSGR